jgi:hypothetical protein
LAIPSPPPPARPVRKREKEGDIRAGQGVASSSRVPEDSRPRERGAGARGNDAVGAPAPFAGGVDDRVRRLGITPMPVATDSEEQRADVATNDLFRAPVLSARADVVRGESSRLRDSATSAPLIDTGTPAQWVRRSSVPPEMATPHTMPVASKAQRASGALATAAKDGGASGAGAGAGAGAVQGTGRGGAGVDSGMRRPLVYDDEDLVHGSAGAGAGARANAVSKGDPTHGLKAKPVNAPAWTTAVPAKRPAEEWDSAVKVPRHAGSIAGSSSAAAAASASARGRATAAVPAHLPAEVSAALRRFLDTGAGAAEAAPKPAKAARPAPPPPPASSFAATAARRETIMHATPRGAGARVVDAAVAPPAPSSSSSSGAASGAGAGKGVQTTLRAFMQR